MPPRLSSAAKTYFDSYGDEVAGWLHLSEIDRAMTHMASDGRFCIGAEVEIALDLMRAVVRRMTDAHVRMVFNIEGA